uniref:DUF4780 domain-containing protein n=1 Tax=Cacopsylla melanoneura TaxID=428564 RepID=A0A8D8MGE2_9HEMI
MSNDKMDTTNVESTELTETAVKSAPMQVEEAEGVREAETTDSTLEIQHAASGLNRLHLRPKLSGAQRRRLQVKRAAERGERAPPRRKSSKPGNEAGDSILAPVSGVNETPRKRQRSQVSTPSTGEHKVLKKSRQGLGCESASGSRGAEGQHTSSSGDTYSQALTGYKMAIVPIDYPEQKLVESCATMLKTYIFKEVLKTPEGTTVPAFFRNSHEKGALVIVCRDEYSRTWLESKVREVPNVLGIQVKVGNYRDVIKEHKAIFQVSKETRNMLGKEDPKEVITLMGFQNPKLKADDISIVSVQNDIKGSTFVVTLDDNALSAIRDSGYKIHLGLELIQIRVPGDRRANANAEGDTDKPPA